MARILQITGPAGTVNLIDASATGIILQRGGGAQGEIPLGLSEGPRLAERWRFNLKGSSHDNVASQLQTLIKLTREAKQFQQELWRQQAVYLQSQTTGESNPRYAPIVEAMDLEIPDRYAFPFEGDSELEGLGLTLVREHPWREYPPTGLFGAWQLTATDGPADDLFVHVANFQDTEDVDAIYVDDGGVFSGSFHATAAWTLFPAVAVAGDALYIGSTNPWKHIVLEIGTAGNFSADLLLEYSNGAAGWPDMALGTDFTALAEDGTLIASEDNLFKSTGQWAIHVFPPAAGALETVNALSRYWIRIRLVTVTSWTTSPSNATNQPYSPRKPYIEIPAAAIKGDSPPLTLLRLHSPSGGGSTPGPACLSRVLIGAKSRNLANFVSHLNAGNAQMPSGWAATYGTDTAVAADTQSPGGQRANVTFATDATMVNRVRLTGTSKLEPYIGEYLAMVRVQQVGGVAGDIKVRLRTLIGGSAATNPKSDTVSEKTRGADKGPEIITLGLISLPFSRVFPGDITSSIDLLFEIHTQRVSGAATLRIYDLILLPVDEGSVGVDDPVSDVVSGASALRGGNALDIDGGVIANRTIKQSSWPASGMGKIAEEWARMNRPIELANLGSAHRLYFVLAHYALGGSWGGQPLAGNLGVGIGIKLFIVRRWAVLRGADV